MSEAEHPVASIPLEPPPLSEQPHAMMEDATGEIDDLHREIRRQRQIATNLSQPLEERLEAFEEIIDSQVGDSTFVRARHLERTYGLRQLFLKFEGSNPTGTQKDRIAFAQVMDAARRGYESITVATCGNYGVAVALAASLAGLTCRVYIPARYHTRRIKEMEQLKALILRVEGDYEQAVKVSSEEAARIESYDANPGATNTPIQLRAYGQIASEIFDELSDAPLVVAVPVSNGTTLAGVYKGFLSLYRRGKTSRIPKIVAGSSFKKNPIVQAVLKNKAHCEDLLPSRIRETAVNEPLINWHASDGEIALQAVRQTGGWAGNATDRQMIELSRQLREKEGLHVLPAATAGLVALLEAHRHQALVGDRYVAVLTGKKV